MDGRVELIGEHVVVSYHTDPSLCGISGTVIDESREMLVIRSDGSKKIISKRPAKFVFKDGELVGKKIAYRPQDRIKKVKA
jgi:RNase P/RNase MRP subunit p29